MKLGTSLLSALFLAACSGSSGPPRIDPPPRPVSVVFQDGETLAYRIVDASGTEIGRTQGTFNRASDGLELVTRLELRPSGAPETAEHATRLGSSFEPRLYKRLSSRRGRFEIKFHDSGLDVSSETGNSEVRREPVSAPVYLPEDMMLLALLIHRSAVVPGHSEVLDVFLPDAQGTEAMNFRMWAEADGRLMVELPSGRAELDSRWHVRRFESREQGLVFELQDDPGPAIELELIAKHRYVRPESADWDDREIRVTVDDGQLAGVVSVPRRRAQWDKKLAPGVLFVTDREAQDRFGHAGDVDRGTWAFQDRLAQAGFIVLRLDDRGVVPNGPATKASADPLARRADFERALDALTRVPESDNQRVVVIGHGEGALLAAQLASRESVAALVLFAPRYKGLEADWARTIEELDRPCLVVQGLADFEVSWKTEAEVLSKLLVAKLGKARTKLAAFDRVDHLMKEEPRTSSRERYRDGSRLVDDRVLGQVTEWIKTTVPGL